MSEHKAIKHKAEIAGRKLQELAQRIKKEHPKATKQEFFELWKAAISADEGAQRSRVKLDV